MNMICSLSVSRPRTALYRALPALAATLLLTAAANPVLAGFVYTGSLASGAGLTGTGDYATGVTLAWEVSQDSPGQPWTYQYTITHPASFGDVSHFIIEVSDTFDTENDPSLNENIISADYPYQNALTLEIGEQSTGGGNPFLPEAFSGIKFDETQPDAGDPDNDPTTDTYTFTLVSTRNPVWGDVYAKDGKTGGPGGGTDITFHNDGFTTPSDTDPGDAAGNGSVDSHVLVPNTFDVPEPTTAGLLGALALSALVRRTRG